MKSFGHIAKRVVLFMVINLLIMVTLGIVLSMLGIGSYTTGRGQYEQLDLYALLMFSLVYGMVTAGMSLALSRVMAKWMMGVKVIPADVREPELQWLLRTVHQQAKRSGINSMPEVGVYDSPEINAFATGPTKNRSLVAVSSGILRGMTKDELEGVLAHEVSHIANGDMVTMTLIQGILNAFIIFFAKAVAFVISQNVKDDARYVVRLITEIVFQIAFAFLAMFVIGYFSRRREYRADAGSAKLVGREKMIAALQRLKGTADMIDDRQQSVASLKISGRGGFLSLISTHPPLEERIARLQSANV
jgi:heat shock protein HtpX